MKRYLSYGVILGLGLSLCILAGPANQLKAEDEAKQPAISQGPQEVVEITAKKLNMRGGPGVTYPDIHILAKGEKLAVIDDKDGWLQVILPDDVPCWVHKKYITVKDEDNAIIRGDKVRVRTAPETTDDNTIAYLAEGTPVTVVKTKDDWYRIEPTETMTGWISKKYTRYWGTYQRYSEMLVAEAHQKHTEETLRLTNDGRFQKAEELYLQQLTKPELQQDYRTALELYRQIADSAPDSEMAKKSRERIQLIEPRERILQAYRDTMQETRNRKNQIDTRHAEKVSQLYSPKSEQPVYDVEGWLDSVGMVYKRPSPYKLIKGDEDLCFVKFPANINPDDYYQKYVGVTGKFIRIEGWNIKAIIVDKIDILTEK